MDKVNRRRFFGMFGAGAAVAAPAAAAATTRFKADLQDATTREVFNESTAAYLRGGGTIPAEDALRVAFLRESEVLMDCAYWGSGREGPHAGDQDRARRARAARPARHPSDASSVIPGWRAAAGPASTAVPPGSCWPPRPASAPATDARSW